MFTIDVLIPTYNRSTALAVTLMSLCSQTLRDFQVIVSDQSDQYNVAQVGEVQAVVRVLRSHENKVQIHKHLPRRGIAEQRHFLLEQATAPYVLFLDDDVILEPWVMAKLLEQMQAENCGFVGNALIGLSFINDVRPHEQEPLEFWQGRVQPEVVKPNTPEWERWRLHNAANPYHLQQRLELSPEQPRLYHVAWIAGCVLFDRQKLLDVGGFSFWQDVPETICGEDVLVQQRVMSRYGGCGLLPSGAYHQELPTTIPDRSQDAHHVLPIEV